MSLRLRLALSTVGAALPLLLAIVLGYRAFARRTGDELVATVILAQSVPEACDGKWSRTVTLPRLQRGPWVRRAETTFELHFADGDGRGAVPVPAALVEELRRGAPLAALRAGEMRLIAVPLPAGPAACAIAFAVVPELQRPLPPLPVLLWPVGVALLAVVAGIGPMVRRTRALTAAVRRWQSDVRALPPPEPKGDELGELSCAFHAAAGTIASQQAQLSARERDLREFVENVSHDLATPLTVLQGHLSALADAQDSPAVRQAMNEAHYLGALLGSLAVTARFESGLTVQSELDLRDVVARVVDRHRGMAARLGVELERFTPDEPVRVSGDPTFTEQALTNLVGNALRYHRAGGHVAVVLDGPPGRFSLRVLDDGPGLSREERERVLRRGARGDEARSRDPAGQGLGLSIVARVAALQGWQFTLGDVEPTGLVAELAGARLPSG